jgi:hypothetical protein
MIIKKIRWNVNVPDMTMKTLKKRKFINYEIKKLKFINRKENGSLKKCN